MVVQPGVAGVERCTPGAVCTTGEDVFVVVQPVVAGVAEKGQIVDVCGAFGGFGPGDDVVGLAPGRLGGAEHAAAVAGDQAATLGVSGGALATAVPQRLAVAGEQQAEQFGVARQALQFALRDRSDAGDLAPSLRVLA